MKIRTLFISDVHLGNWKSNPKALLGVFKKYEFDNLIILGDFIDLTSLKRKFFWTTDHSTVIQKVLRYSRKGVNVKYIIGNHDYYLRSLIEDKGIKIGDIDVVDELIWETASGEKIYICHGDQFDGFVRIHPFLYRVGDLAYEFSFKINYIYNIFRRVLNLNEWSLSSYLKKNVKDVISFVNNFKITSTEKAKENGCKSIMIGHIHTPCIELGEVNYYNTGDFCETVSCIVESMDGEITLVFPNKK
jgi:UDP-2,3-diacylglucosamine pyrophosphatase LpxH